MLLISIDQCKVKRGSWSRSLAGPWLAKHYLPYKICIFSCSTFSHYLFTDSPCLAPQTQATFQRYILMFLSHFGFSMIKIKRPKLNHKNEKTRWIWVRQLKSIEEGCGSKGDLCWQNPQSLAGGGGGKWGKGYLPLFYFYLARNLGPKIAWHAREPPRRVKMSKTLIST